MCLSAACLLASCLLPICPISASALPSKAEFKLQILPSASAPAGFELSWFQPLSTTAWVERQASDGRFVPIGQPRFGDFNFEGFSREVHPLIETENRAIYRLRLVDGYRVRPEDLGYLDEGRTWVTRRTTHYPQTEEPFETFRTTVKNAFTTYDGQPAVQLERRALETDQLQATSWYRSEGTGLVELASFLPDIGYLGSTPDLYIIPASFEQDASETGMFETTRLGPVMITVRVKWAPGEYIDGRFYKDVFRSMISLREGTGDGPIDGEISSIYAIGVGLIYQRTLLVAPHLGIAEDWSEVLLEWSPGS